MKHLLLVAFLLPFCLHAQNIYTIAGTGMGGYTGDGGPATHAEMNQPDGVAIDAAGNCYIADWQNNVVRKVNTAGVITTFAGKGAISDSGDGGQATAAGLILATGGVAVDHSGNVYIACALSIRKVSTSGIISTVAGNGISGYSGDGGPATNAKLHGANSVKVDAAGNIYIADENNNVVRKVSTAGIITTIAGTGAVGYSGDGGAATSATLNLPAAVAVDASGNVYIADDGNNAIRKVSTAGIITTYAGPGIIPYLGDGGPATAGLLQNPYDVAVDQHGNLFIGDYGDYRIRKVNTSGIISTVAGNGNPGYTGDGGPATNATIGWNSGVGVDASGNLFIADAANNVVRRVNLGTSGISNITVATQVVAYPNPCYDHITVTGVAPQYRLCLYNLAGAAVYTTTASGNYEALSVSNLLPGTYTLQVWDEAGNNKVTTMISKL